MNWVIVKICPGSFNELFIRGIKSLQSRVLLNKGSRINSFTGAFNGQAHPILFNPEQILVSNTTSFCRMRVSEYHKSLCRP